MAPFQPQVKQIISPHHAQKRSSRPPTAAQTNRPQYPHQISWRERENGKMQQPPNHNSSQQPPKSTNPNSFPSILPRMYCKTKESYPHRHHHQKTTVKKGRRSKGPEVYPLQNTEVPRARHVVPFLACKKTKEPNPYPQMTPFLFPVDSHEQPVMRTGVSLKM